jgi:helicase
MRMQGLLAHGFPEDVIALWQLEESDTLLPLQELVVKRNDLFGPGNLLVQAPTSSGKTFIGEMAAVHTALHRRQVVYLVPLKALAEEKYEVFRRKYEPYGMRVIVSTRDRREFDRRLEDGAFSIAVVVYEKLSQLLVRRPERIKNISLVIADELEILSDPDRGAGAEILLTQILLANCRLIGLSAVIGAADKLARWFGAELVAHDRRPIELRYGVLHGGVFRYRTYNGLTEEHEPLGDAIEESPRERLQCAVGTLTERGEACLVFVKAKHECRIGAAALARRLALPRADGAIDRLNGCEPTHCREHLLETLEHGVAFHNADLSTAERRIVEDAFRRGEVRVLVSTSTLAVGLNLPAHNVFIAPDKWQYDRRFATPWKTPILHTEYENMSGRAGRFGTGMAFGRSILVASTPFEEETLWRRYVEGDREAVAPRLGREPLEDHILKLVAGRTCATELELQDFLNATLTGAWVWTDAYSEEESQYRVTAAINKTIDFGLIARGGDGRLTTTPFGRASSAAGINTETAVLLSDWIAQAELRDWPVLELLVTAAAAPVTRDAPVGMSQAEYAHCGYLDELVQGVAGCDCGVGTVFARLVRNEAAPSFEEMRAIKLALIAAAWIDETALYEIEERFQTLSGQIAAGVEQVAWLIQAAAGISEACGGRSGFVQRIQALALRVQRGVGEDLLPLAQLSQPRLSRTALLALHHEGLHTPEALAEAPQDILAQHLSHEDAVLLQQWAVNSHTPSSRSTGGEVAPPASPPALLIDERKPNQIWLDGQCIELQDKQFRLIQILAESPGRYVSYDDIYDRIWGDVVVEQGQMAFQKSRLLDRIKRKAPRRANVVQTIAKRGYKLDLPPDAVRVLPPREQLSFDLEGDRTVSGAKSLVL